MTGIDRRFMAVLAIALVALLAGCAEEEATDGMDAPTPGPAMDDTDDGMMDADPDADVDPEGMDDRGMMDDIMSPTPDGDMMDDTMSDGMMDDGAMMDEPMDDGMMDDGMDAGEGGPAAPPTFPPALEPGT